MSYIANVTSNMTTQEPTHFPYHMLGFTAACAFIIAIIGAAGNLLTIIALPMSRPLRTTATAFVVNLAVCELLFCVLVLPLAGAQYAYLRISDGESLLSDTSCIFFAVVRYTLTQLHLQTILGISLMRAISVSCLSFYNRINNPWFVGAYIAILWIYSFALKLPTAMGKFGYYYFNIKTMECGMAYDDDSTRARGIMLLVEAIIPVLTIIILYIFIFIMVKFKTRRSERLKINRGSSVGSEFMPEEVPMKSVESQAADVEPGEVHGVLHTETIEIHTRKLSRRLSSLGHCEDKLSQTIFIIFLVTIFCSVPVAVLHYVDSQVRDKNRFLLVHILYWIQYSINVIIYVLMNRHYRSAYLETLSKIISCSKEK